MFTLPGFKNVELLLERGQVGVYRAFSETHGTSVILKILRSEYPSQTEIDRYQKEFQLLKTDLGPGVPKAIEFLQIAKSRVMVLEDIGGSKIQRTVGGQVRSIENLLELSTKIVSILAKVHEAGIIHGDINHDNIISNDQDGRVQIIDFGLSEKASAISDQQSRSLQGTLRFISPEQTGRTQRAIDYRSDFYNLGVTLYYLFSGSYPFEAADDMAWVHQHMAAIEQPLYERDPQIPLSVSMVVQKLMKKSPEERYQSCLGLQYDLELCLQEIRSGERNTNFKVGAQDISSEFHIANKLYGREKEIEFLNQTLTKVVKGERKLVLVDGDPGVGKSTLIDVIRGEVNGSQGYFIKGKYDQFQKDIPFSAFIQAFDQLINQVLSETDEQINEWRARLLLALEGNGAIVTAVIPRLELIIGKQEAAETLRGNERRQRFLSVFHKFIRSCCQRGIPLVIFLDDVQWADSASRGLIAAFLTDSSTESLFFILAYRHREVDETHPLRNLLRDLEQAYVSLDRIHLGDLAQIDVLRMIQDTFHSEKVAAEQLADLIYTKTKGNPFFVAQFLSRLHERGIVHFEAKTGWTWDLEQVRRLEATENVLSLLTEKISSLPENSRRAMQLASCLGNRFHIDQLSLYNGISNDQNIEILKPTITFGLLQKSDDGNYRFVHDRVHEAAYQLTSAQERSEFHWKIANEFLKSLSSEKIQEDIFSVCNHWNLGSSLATSEESRVQGARLNLQAALKAKDASVYDLTMTYAQTGLQCLSDHSWEKYADELKNLNLIYAETLYSLSRFDQAEKVFDVLLEKTKASVERARIYRTRLELAHMMRRYEESIRWGALGLTELKFKLPLKPGKLSLLMLLMQSRRQFKKMSGLLNNERTTELEPEVELTLRLLGSLSEPAFFVNKNLLLYVGLSALNISIEHGQIEWEATAFYATVMWRKMNKFSTAVDFCQVAVPHLEAQPRSSAVARSLFVVGGFLLPFVESYKVGFRILEKAYQMLLQNGDLVYAGSTALYIGSLHAIGNRSLANARSEIVTYLTALNKNGDVMIGDSLQSVNLYLRCLAGETLAPDSFSLQDLSEEDWIKQLAQHETPNPRAWYGAHKMAALSVMGYGEEAVKHLANADWLSELSPFTSGSTMCRILGALTQLRYIKGSDSESRKARMRGIKANLKFLKAIAGANPRNFQAPYLMLQAEVQRVSGNLEKATELHQRAVLAARKGDAPLYEALSCELAGEAHLENGNEMVGMFYMREALFAYEGWGAIGKVKRLRERFPHLGLINSVKPGSDTSRSRESASQTNVNLDVNTILKATNTLLTEIEMEPLIHKLLVILIQNAGADRGLLMMSESGHLTIKGEVHVSNIGEFKLTDIPVESFSQISKPVISYVARSSEPRVIENVFAHEDFGKDEYARKVKLKSVMCVPILSQGELKGIVYLENNKSEAVFSPDRLELIRVLAGQAAISIENARLYSQQGEKIRMEQELVTAKAVQETLFPGGGKELVGASVGGYYQPASECGGDWWYYSEVGNRVYIWVGDATGHGAPAALVTSAACSAVSILETMPNLTPDLALRVLNRAIYRTSRGNIQMTFFVGALDKTTGEFTYAKASHDPPLVIRSSQTGAVRSDFREFRQKVEVLTQPNGMRLGSEADVPYESGSIQLQPGDQVVLYTDGLTELMNLEGKMWGERGFHHAVYQAYGVSSKPREVIGEIINRSFEFSGGANLNDDITVCVLKFNGPVMSVVPTESSSESA